MLLRVENLHTVFAPKGSSPVNAVRGVSFSVDRGQTVGIVGESGSGKSVTALSISRLIDPPGQTTHGQVYLDDIDLLKLSEREMRSIRGASIAFVFQDPMTALNPVLTVGQQIAETIRAHQKMSVVRAKEMALSWLDRVKIPQPKRRFNQYPFELSGGMRQRVMLAIAFSCNPKVLIADEPTTALDVTVQAEILDVIDSLKKELGTAVLLITHDLSVVAERCDRVAVMYAGQIVEEASTRQLFTSPFHPYTKSLLNCIPDVWAKQDISQELPYLRGRPPRLTLKTIKLGCAFEPRCSFRLQSCTVTEPLLNSVDNDRSARCLLFDETYAAEAANLQIEREKNGVRPAA